MVPEYLSTLKTSGYDVAWMEKNISYLDSGLYYKKKLIGKYFQIFYLIFIALSKYTHSYYNSIYDNVIDASAHTKSMR